MVDSNTEDGPHEDQVVYNGSEDEDSDFYDSDNDVEEDDDLDFEANITHGIEFGPHVSFDDEKSSSYAPTSELHTDYSSEDGECVTYPEFVAARDMANPQFKVGLKFGSYLEFKEAVRMYGVRNRYNTKFKKNDKRRCEAICVEGCLWRIYASKAKDKETVQIKSFHDTHSCAKEAKNRHVTYRFLAYEYLERFKVDPTWKTEGFMATVKSDLEAEISRTVACRARRLALEIIEGTEEKQFALLVQYAAEVRRTNPGSTVMILRDENVFKGIYICLNALKNGFQQGCRNLISLDGCFLKREFGGQLLSAIGIDGNNCIYPIAYAVVEKEKSVIDLLVWIHMKLMQRIQMKRDSMKKQQGTLCPKIMKELMKNQEEANKCEAIWNGGTQYRVNCAYGDFVVDLERNTCACRKWDLSGIPCAHAVAAILKKRDKPMNYVSEWYSLENYSKTYENLIYPINGKDMWPEVIQQPVKPPHWVTKKRGRKQKKRRKQLEEIVENQLKMSKKKQVEMTCSVCHAKGHNKRFHNDKNHSQISKAANCNRSQTSEAGESTGFRATLMGDGTWVTPQSSSHTKHGEA